MANKPISEYDELEALALDTAFIGNRNGESYSFTFEMLIKSIDPAKRAIILTQHE